VALRRRSLAPFVAGAFIAASIAAPGSVEAKKKGREPSAPTHDSVQEELDAVRKNIEKNAALEKQRGAKVSRVLGEMRTFDDRLLASARKREELKIEERDLEKAYERRLSDLEDIETRYRDARAVLQRRLSSVYKRGRLGSTRVLATAATSTEPLRIARYLAALSKADGSVLARFENVRYQHEAALREIADKKKEIAAKNEALQREAERYDAARKEKAMLLAGLQEELAAQHTTAEKLKAAEEDLQKLLASIPPLPPAIAADEPVGPEPPKTAEVAAAAQLAAATAPPEQQHAKPRGPLERLFRAQNAAAPFAERKGDLEVPVRGALVTGYGQQKETGPRVHGLTVNAANDQHVLAVARGEVVFSGPFPGLGNTLIINHGGRYHTVYAHLDGILHEVGARVRENEVIATLSTTDPTLHFELRAEGKPVDPIAWFRGGKEAFKP
jgi:septal ring factor EnvC (AmiA/AmiB activator)